MRVKLLQSVEKHRAFLLKYVKCSINLDNYFSDKEVFLQFQAYLK